MEEKNLFCLHTLFLSLQQFTAFWIQITDFWTQFVLDGSWVIFARSCCIWQSPTERVSFLRTFPFFFLHITRASLILAKNYIFPLTGTLRKNVLVRQAIYCFKYISWTPCAWQVQRSELHRGYLKQEMGTASKWMPVEKQLHDCSSPPLWTFFPPPMKACSQSSAPLTCSHWGDRCCPALGVAELHKLYFCAISLNVPIL